MSRTLNLILALGLAAGAYFVLQPWLSSDERVIRTRLDELADTVSRARQEQGVMRLGLAVNIGEFLTPDVLIDPGEPFPAIRGREAIVAMAAKAPVPGGGVRIEFVDVQVWVAEDRQSATAYLTVTGEATDRSDRDVVDARELEMSLRKTDGEWLIEWARGIDAIEPVR